MSKKQLNLFDLSMIVVSLVIGMGIFRTPVVAAARAGTPTVFFLAWGIGGIIALCGVAIAAIGATLIQFWFRAQVKRSLFRRRHVSSRIATFAEALSSIIWAGAGAIAAVNLWVAIVPGALALFVLGVAWLLSPRRQ